MPRTAGLSQYSDVHYTRDEVAKFIVDAFAPKGRVLEPFRGGGAFFNHLPEGAMWDEIQQGRDFFLRQQPCDWIVTNPPFSNLTEIMAHCFALSTHTVLLAPLSKFYSSAPRLRLARGMAGLRRQLEVGTGRDIGFDIGFPFAAMEFVQGYTGPIYPIDGQALDLSAINMTPWQGDLE
jgi:hypothetical protein